MACNPEVLKSVPLFSLLDDEEAAVLASQVELKRFARRSIQSIRSVKKGDRMEEGVNLDILRPGNKSQGLHPKHISEINDKTATRDIDIGEGILEGDYE